MPDRHFDGTKEGAARSVPERQGAGAASPSKLIIKNTIYNFLKTVSSIAFPLISFPYVARVLGATNLGKINFSTSIISYFSLIATLGITTYAVRSCSQYKQEKDKLSELSSQILSINIVTMLVSYLLLALTLLYFEELRPYQLLISIHSVSILFTTIGADWLNTAMEDFRYITLRTFAFQLISLAAMFVFVRSEGDYYRYALITVFASSGAGIANLVYRRRFCTARFTLRIDWKKHLPPIMWLFVMILSQTIMQNIDSTMLGLLQGDHAVGLYGTAAKLIHILIQAIASIAWVMMPQLSRAFAERDYKVINSLLNGAWNFTLILGIPCIIGVFLFADDLLLVVGGTEYAGAVSCLRILTVSMFFKLINGIYGNMILLPSCRERQFMVACVVGTLVNTVGNYILIPHYGIEGAAFMTAVSDAVILIVDMIGIDGRIKLNTGWYVWKGPILATLAMASFGLLLCSQIEAGPFRLVLLFLIGSPLYFLVLFISGNQAIQQLAGKLLKKTRCSDSSH